MRLRNPLVIGLLVTAIVVILTASYRLGWRVPLLTGMLEILELHTLDWRFKLRGPQKPGPEVVILANDDHTYERDPALFERRDGWVKMLAALEQAGAKVVGIDALFVEPEQLLNQTLQKDIAEFFKPGEDHALVPPDALGLLRRVHHETQADSRLEAAIASMGNVILGFHLGFSAGNKSADPNLAKAAYGQAVPGHGSPPEGRMVVASMPSINARAQGLGIITVAEDDTRSVRRMIAVRKYNGAFLAPLAVKLAAALRELPPGRVAYLGQSAEHGGHLRLGEQSIDLDQGLGLWLNFRGPRGTFPTWSVSDLVEGQLPQGALEDKIVLVGFTFFGHDTVSCPFSSSFPGVEVHATAVDNLLRGDFLQRSSWWLDTLVSLLLGLAFTMLFWPRLSLSPTWQVGLALLVLGAYLALSHVLFVNYQVWLLWSGPMVVFLLVAGTCLVLSYLAEGIQRRQLRHAFAHYLSDDVIEQVLDHPDSLKLGGERRELTVLFSDIRGFTTISEGLPPEALSDLLNEYLTPMSDVVFENRGTLDKYMGDAIMAIYGAPVPDDNHARRACETALSMLEELALLQRGWRERKLPELDIGIGVNSGMMSVGNMGSKARFDYTVLGDQVNLGSRLEGLNKQFGTGVIVSEFTRAQVLQDFTFRELDLVAVKGRSEPVRIYELVHRGPSDPHSDAWIEEFESALAAYRARKWDQASEQFAQLARGRKDPAAQAYLARCDQMREDPPKEGWDGVLKMTSK